MIIAQIATGLPPKVDGVGDYAAIIADSLRSLGLESRFILPFAETGASSVPFQVRRLDHNSGESLESALNDSGAERMVLHFSGYGYARWGLCWWLVEGIRRWRAADVRRKLVTVFHELFAVGPIWRASFWTSPPQRAIARKLVELSHAAVATSDMVAEQIRTWPCAGVVKVIPVFSNVGEPAIVRPLGERESVAVIFGQTAQRSKAYDRLLHHSDSLGPALRGLGVDRIVDIGPAAPNPHSVRGVPVIATGPMAASEVSQRLANARVGLVAYPAHVLTKSGIAAAYFSHQLLLVNLMPSAVSSGGLIAGRHFVGGLPISGSFADYEQIAAEGHAWYCEHGRRETARTIAELLQ